MDLTSKQAFKQLFHEMYNPLCNFVFKMVKSEAKSEDIVQEVFIKIWEKRTEIDASDNIKSYLFTACRNKTLEIIRKEATEKEHVGEKLKLDVPEATDIETESERFVKLERINKSIRQLPPKCRQVFLLHRKNGLTYREIAEHLSISHKTVENHMIKALNELRKSLKPRKD